jgi:hypothetical protein
MTLENVLWIALSAALAFGLAWWAYFYKAGTTPRKYLLFALRFLGLFGALALLMPLDLEKATVFTEPHRLLLVLDNSASVGRSPGREEIERIRESFREDRGINERFALETYTFGAALRRSDSLDFSDRRTDITSALQALSKASLDGNSSIVLATDGIQNLGRGITTAPSNLIPVFPIAVGDTTAYRDIRIDGLNANRFAFLDNQFPLEVLISYRGEDPVTTRLTLFDNGKQVYQAQVRLDGGRAAERLSVLLPARKVGFHTLSAAVAPLENERNTGNNRLTTGIEVLDETTRVRIVSRITHPDIGALSRSVEANEQRSVELIEPREVPSKAAETDLWIFYQPDASFETAYEALEKTNTPLFTLTGPGTNWEYLNSRQRSFLLDGKGPEEELLPEPNPSFAYFDSSDWDVTGYPPLLGSLGEYQILQPHEAMLGQRVRGVSLNQPLMALIKGAGRREAVLFGSGIWKWRMHAYIRDGDFQNFDLLMGKLWLFLGAGKEGERLNLEYESLYDGQKPPQIRAWFYDEALRFDPAAALTLQLRDSTGQVLDSYPMALAKGEYRADISGLAPGTYSFEVQAGETGYRRSGNFRVQDFDLESQQVRSEDEALLALAEASGGTLYYPAQLDQLKDSLLTLDRFRPLSRSQRNVVSLIDFRWLLALIAAALGAEWFIRKYNGLF